ncbi:MAG: C2H2-type zinc finger protein [Endozoicomonadaceae bacterium]|nr:C2H2-type zinc finger protein [Endozoicomonadaceae bacterium]
MESNDGIGNPPTIHVPANITNISTEEAEALNDGLSCFIDDLLSEHRTVTTIANPISNNAMLSTLSDPIHSTPRLRLNSDTESEKYIDSTPITTTYAPSTSNSTNIPIEATEEELNVAYLDDASSFFQYVLVEPYSWTVTTISPSISNNNTMPSTLSGPIHPTPILRPNSDTESEKFDTNILMDGCHSNNLVPNFQELLPIYRTATATATTTTATQSRSDVMLGTSSGSVHQMTRSKFDFLPCSDTESAEKAKAGSLIKASETGVQEKTITTTKMRVEWINGKSYHVCNKCNKKYVYQYRSNEHKCSGTRKIHTCDICKMIFASRGSLSVHVREIHEATHNVYCCTICSKAFKTQRYLKAHMCRHFEDKSYICTRCLKGFKHSATLKNHNKSKKGCIKNFN